MSGLLCTQSARVHAGWSEKCWCGKSWSSGPFWPLCNTFVQSGNGDSMDYGIAVGFVLCLRVPTEIKALLWLVLHTHRKRRCHSQSFQSNRQDRWKRGSRRGTQKWSDLPEVTQQVSDRAKNKKPCYFLPAWCPLPKAMYRISLRLKCSQPSAGPLPAAECSCTVEWWLLLSAREHCAQPLWVLSTGTAVLVCMAVLALALRWSGSPIVILRGKHRSGAGQSVCTKDVKSSLLNTVFANSEMWWAPFLLPPYLG